MTTSAESKVSEHNKFLLDELNKMQDDIPDYADDIHKLFLFYIAKNFENIEPNNLKKCEGKSDKQIDFYEDGENKFVAYQCKIPEIKSIDKDKVTTYGPDLISEADRAIKFLTDTSGKIKGNVCAQEARTRYWDKKSAAEQEKGVYKIEVVLAFWGKLTDQAQQELDALKIRLDINNVESPYNIKIIDYDYISTLLEESLLKGQRPVKLILPIYKGEEVHTSNWAYTLVPAIEFVNSFEKYKNSLFDANVRYYLENSNINKDIIETVKRDEGQKYFHLLNNGITISCDSWDPPKKQNKNKQSFTLHHPQIINGCQTIVSLHRAYMREISEPRKREHFKEKCLVPVRIILPPSIDLEEEIVRTSNNQNKMSPRNLRANTRFQRIIQRKFNSLKFPWFYEKKDGEFRSYINHPPKHFKEDNFKIGTKQYKFIDNQLLAKTWLSFIGFSKDASERIYAFEDNLPHYKRLFEMCPNTEHWLAFSTGLQVEWNDNHLISKNPSPEHYLISYLIYHFVKHYLPPPQENRANSIQNMRRSGAIDDSAPAEVENVKLLGDPTYVLNQILYNMKEVIVELFSWILVKRYGPIDDEKAVKILALSGFNELFENPDYRAYANNLRNEEDLETKMKNVLFSCFSFISDTVEWWYDVKKEEYKTQQRRIRYLHHPSTIQEFKRFMIKVNDETQLHGNSYKPPKKKFIDTLPDLQ